VGWAAQGTRMRKNEIGECVGLRFCSDTSDEQTSWENWSKYYWNRY